MCGETKEKEVYFYKLGAKCKYCRKILDQIRYQANLEYNREQGRIRSQKWYSKPENKIHKKEYQNTPENKPKYTAIRRNNRLKNKERDAARYKLWNINNKERIATNHKLRYENNKQKRIIQIEDYRRRTGYYHTPRFISKRNARNMARRRNMEKPDQDTINAVELIRKMPCGYCGNTGGTVDHVLPVSRGGINHWTNMVPACQRCNDSKGTKTPEEWKNRWYLNG